MERAESAHERARHDHGARGGLSALRAAESFQRLEAELAEIEDEIQAARRIYNSNVQGYNSRIQTFPTVLVAGSLSFEARDFFEVEVAAERAVPAVAF